MYVMNFIKIIKTPNRFNRNSGIFFDGFLFENGENFCEPLIAKKKDLIRTRITINNIELWAISNIKDYNSFCDLSIAEFYNGKCKKYISGNVIICGRKNDNYESLSKDQMIEIKDCFKNGFLKCKIDNISEFVSRIKKEKMEE